VRQRYRPRSSLASLARRLWPSWKVVYCRCHGPRQPLVLGHGQQWMFDPETLRLTASGDYRRFMRSLSTYDHCLSSMWPTVDGLMLDFKSSGQGETP